MKLFSQVSLFLFIVILAFFQGIYAQGFVPYTILISFDGFRWDYPQRGITPTLDMIAGNGVSAISLQPSFPTKTFPNHYTIVTGLYPQNHGLISNNMYDPVFKEYFSLGNRSAVENSRWYKGEAIWETARKQGIKTASYFWPGSEVDIEYRRPDYFHYYEHKKPYQERINGVIEWLKLPYEERPKFITLYFDAADTDGHIYGPESDSINSTIVSLDKLLNTFIDLLKEIKLFDSTNIILVSDHGMCKISSERIINIDKLLRGLDYKTIESGPIMFVYPGSDQKQLVYSALKQKEFHYRVYFRENLPEHYHLSASHLLSEVFIIADPGWSLITDKIAERDQGRNFEGGDHGYDNYYLDMHGFFYAIGPSFKTGFRTGTVQNIDIYPLLCKILNIKPRQNIDGKLERIQAILREY